MELTRRKFLYLVVMEEQMNDVNSPCSFRYETTADANLIVNELILASTFS